MAEESFFSGPNVTWFALGIAAEFFFLGFGITPQGMNVGAEVASALGLTGGFNAASTTVVASTTSGLTAAAPVVAPTVVETMGGVSTMGFGIK